MRALRAMGYDPGDPEAVSRAVAELDAEPWLAPLLPLYIVEAEAAQVALQLPPGEEPREVNWVLRHLLTGPQGPPMSANATQLLIDRAGNGCQQLAGHATGLDYFTSTTISWIFPVNWVSSGP